MVQISPERLLRINDLVDEPNETREPQRAIRDTDARLAGVYCGSGRQIPKSSFLCSLSRSVGITHGG